MDEENDNTKRIFSLVQQLLGISQRTTEQMIDTLSVSGELPQAIEAVEALYDELGVEDETQEDELDGTIDSPDDPDNTDMQRFYDKRDTDGWNPEGDREQSEQEQQQNVVDGDIDGDMYNAQSRKEPVRERASFMTFLERRAHPDATISDMADDIEDDFDDITKRKIDMHRKNNNDQMADRVRNQALQRNKSKQPRQPETPAERRVEHQKKQLNKAVHQANKQDGNEEDDR